MMAMIPAHAGAPTLVPPKTSHWPWSEPLFGEMT
jgi:hypothetical protein